MNYYKPSELADENGNPAGIFHMTCTNDGSVWPIGYCRENKNSETKCRHKSPEEASDCYRAYCREQQGGNMAGFPMVEGDEGTVLNIASSY